MHGDVSVSHLHKAYVKYIFGKQNILCSKSKYCSLIKLRLWACKICNFVNLLNFLISKFLWKIKSIKDILSKLTIHWQNVRITCSFRIRFRSGKSNSGWNELLSLITRWIWWKLQVHVIGSSDHSNWVSIQRLPSKKAYTQRVYSSPTVIFLSKIVNKFITSAILAVMISSVEIHGKTGYYMMWFFQKRSE